ncbi:MAG: N-acetylneuraminate synthase family protein [Treponemataceae bacterium]|nr:MAG: N-acetylneuraminate synthase family protein [Treponemataceae bacterium]
MEGARVLIVAEIGTAHGGNPQKAMELIDASVRAGADCVKFQWVYAHEILHPATGTVPLPGGDTRLYDVFKSLECPPEFYADAMSYARSRGMKFMCSPFGIQSLEELISLNPDAVKIASPELNHYPLLRRLARILECLRVQPKVIVSSGVSTLADIEAALGILRPVCAGIALLHCITAYPAPEDEYNLRLIETLGRVFGIQTGVSDHSLDPALVPVLSVCMGAKIVEKHITLSRNGDGLDDPVALEPEAFSRMSRAVRKAESIIAEDRGDVSRALEDVRQGYGAERVARVLGDGVKRFARAEEGNYGRTNRSLHYTRPLKKGSVADEGDYAALRTEKILSPGISPRFFDFVRGKRLTRDVADGDGIQLEDFCQ